MSLESVLGGSFRQKGSRDTPFSTRSDTKVKKLLRHPLDSQAFNRGFKNHATIHHALHFERFLPFFEQYGMR